MPPVFLDHLAVSPHLKEYIAGFLYAFPLHEYVIEQCIAVTLTCLGLIFIDVVFFGKTSSSLVINKIWKSCVGVLTILLYPVVYQLVNRIVVNHVIDPEEVVVRLDPEESDIVIYERNYQEAYANDDSESLTAQFRTVSMMKCMKDVDEESGLWSHISFSQCSPTEESGSYVTAADDTDSSGAPHKKDNVLPGVVEMNSCEKVVNWNCQPISRRRSHPCLEFREDNLDSDLGFDEQFYLSHPQLNTI